MNTAAQTIDAPPVIAFEVTVSAVQDLTPSFRRITFTGESLKDFGVNGPTFDLRIKLMIAAPGHPLPEISPEPGDKTGMGWYQRWLAMDPEVRGVMRTYTVRHARLGGDRPEIDVDFVLHGADDDGGPASRWALAAAPGNVLTIIGPNARAHAEPARVGIEWRPGRARRVLLAGDETAVPAMCAILESLPAEMRGDALLEVPSLDDVLDIATASGVRVVWLPRNGERRGDVLGAEVRRIVPAGDTAGDSETWRDLREIDVDRELLWETAAPGAPEDGETTHYAWIAGEAAMVKELRRHLVRDAGQDKRQVSFMGYWRQGRAEGA